MRLRCFALALVPAVTAVLVGVGGAVAVEDDRTSPHYVQKILGLYIPTAIGQESVPAAAAEGTNANLNVPVFSRIVIDPKGASRLEGVGTPGSRIVLNSSGRTIGAAIVETDGRWLVTLNEGLPPGEHRISSGVSTNGTGNGKVLYGDEVRIAVPEDMKGAAVVAYEARPEPPVAPGGTARQRGEELGRAANEKFNDVVPPKSFPPSPDKKFDGRLAQEQPAPKSAPPVEAPKAEPDADTEPSSVTGAVVDWLRRSAREYNGVIIKDLSVPAPGTSAPADQETASDKPAPALPVPSAQPPKDNDSGKAAKDLVDERRKAEEAYRLRQQAETKRKAEETARLNAEKVRKAAEAKKAAEDLARAKAGKDAEIQEGLRSLEAAKKDTDAKTAAEAKRIAEEAERKDAARKAAEAEAKKEAGKKQPKPVEAKTADKGDQPAPLGVKPQPESFEDAVAEEQRKSVEAEQGEPIIEDDSDILDEPRQTVRAAKSKKSYRRADASRTRGWRSKRGVAAGCRYGRTYHRRKALYYVVGPTDTLWSIANKYCGSGPRYPWIFNANRRRMSDPDIVWTCMRLRIPKACTSRGR